MGKKFAAACFIFVIILSIINLPQTANAAEDQETVRIGYFLMDGFQEISKTGEYSGYNYEYLKKIAQYTDWQYEFVEAPWESCLTMLQNGEIDLLALSVMSDVRKEQFDFADASSGFAAGCLITRGEDATYAYQDYSSFDGMTVGMLNGNVRNSQFEALEREYGFTTYKSEYATIEELLAALQNGEVEAIVLTNMIDMTNMRVIAQFSSEPFYYITTKGNTQIMRQLNEALTQIKNNNSFYDYQLYQKYYMSNASYMPVFTVEEREYIKENPVISVAYTANREPIAYCDKQSGEFSGITAEIMKLLSESIGFTFTYTELPSGTTAIKYMKENDIMVLAGASESPVIALSPDLITSESMLNTQLVYVVRRNDYFEPNARQRIALTNNNTTGISYFEENHPNLEAVLYDTPAQCMEAVKNEKADSVLLNIYMAQRIMEENGYTEDLMILPVYSLEEHLKLCLVDTDDNILLSILNKAILSLEMDEVNKIVVRCSSYGMDVSLASVIKGNPIQAIGIIVAIFLLIILLLGIMIYYMYTRNSILKEVNRKAQFDELTGIYNKKTFYNKTQALLDKNKDKTYVMVRMDIDHFKLYNDFFGMKAGDKLLCYIARLLAEQSDDTITYGRIESDHFAFCYDLGQLEPEKITQITQKNLKSFLPDFEITVCLGFYVIEDRDCPVESMCERALLALKAAKDNYISHYGFYDDSMRNKLIQEQLIISEMQNALEQNQFIIYLQPQVELATGKVVGAEALVRWQHPARGLIMPNDFIPVFEKNGFIMQLDEYVWEETCKVLHRWGKEGRQTMPISVNLSRIDIYNPNLCGLLEELIDKYGLSSNSLNLEVTESAYVEKPLQLIEVIDRLRLKGFILEMDDFGSGYSSLNSLKNLPVDVLKLDLHFLSEDGAEMAKEKGSSIITAVVMMAKWLNLKVLAEGIETEEQVKYLQSIGCEYGQGYYYARPMPVADFERFMENM